MRQLRQPRLAEIVAASLREEILTGRLKEGDSLPRQEHLFAEYRVSLPAVREALRILETEGLISVRRGNVGGAVVHLPSAERTARMISMVLQARNTTLGDVSAALLHIEPVCAVLCARREDRATEVVPALRAALERQRADTDDADHFAGLALEFHKTLVERCGSETLKVLIGSLETIWSSHESTVMDEAVEKAAAAPAEARAAGGEAIRRAALKDHERILAAIEKGDGARTSTLMARHLATMRTGTLGLTSQVTVRANLLDTSDFARRRRA